jgi:hypothetical protein
MAGGNGYSLTPPFRYLNGSSYWQKGSAPGYSRRYGFLVLDRGESRARSASAEFLSATRSKVCAASPSVVDYPDLGTGDKMLTFIGISPSE